MMNISVIKNKSIVITIFTILIVALSYYSYVFIKKRMEVKIGALQPNVKLLENTKILDDSIDKKYRGVKVVNSENKYFKFKEEISYLISRATGTELNTLRYAELKLDDKYNKDQHIKNSSIFLDSTASREMKLDILYFLLHDFLETSQLGPSFFALSQSKTFSKYLVDFEKINPAYKNYKSSNVDYAPYQDRIEIYLDLNNLIAKDYPSLAANSTLAHKYIELYIRTKNVAFLEKSKENYIKANSILDGLEATTTATVNDYVVGLNHFSAATSIYNNLGFETSKDPIELSKNAVYYSNKYKTDYTMMSVYVYSYVLANQKDVNLKDLKVANNLLIKNKKFLASVLKTNNVTSGKMDTEDRQLFSLNTLRLMSVDEDFADYLSSTGFDLNKLK